MNLDAVGGLHPAGLHRDQTTLLAVPAAGGHEVPALLGWPGGRDCGLGGAEHYAILRHFHHHYGAELLTLDPARMDLLIRDRPRTPKAVARAALELYAYCPEHRPPGLRHPAGPGPGPGPQQHLVPVVANRHELSRTRPP